MIQLKTNFVIMRKINFSRGGIVFILILFFVSCTNKVKTSDKEQFVEKLLSEMTLEEKVGQLNLIPYEGSNPEELRTRIEKGEVGAILKSNGVAQNNAIQKIAIESSRLKIPIMFHEDVIHGYKTISPTPLAESCSWDLDLIRHSASIAAKEAAASGIHLTYAPMVDISIDPRWGRILEGGGEDAYLGSLIAAARVKGFQGNNLADTNTVMACVKHFAGYGASLAGRDYNIINFSERELMETYLPPFKAAIDAGVGSVMCAYTAVQCIPATANKYLLTDVLKNQLGFKGLLMTDWSTIPNLVKIGVAPNDTVAAKMALDAGVEMDMTSEVFIKLLPEMVRKGLVEEKVVDNAVRKVLNAKYDLGLFQYSFAYFSLQREKNTLLSKQNLEQTKQIALESMVLLKNTQNTLPLNSNIRKLAVVGPFAKAKKDLMGWWWCKGIPEDVTSVYDGISKIISPNTELLYAQGCDIDSFRIAGREKIREAVTLVRNADAVVVVLGEEYWMSGEGGGKANLHLPSAQEELLTELKKTGKPVITVLITGRPYVLTDVVKNSDAVLQAWMPGTTGGEAVADILFGKFNPCGKLTVTFPYHEGQVPICYNYRSTSHDFNGKGRYITKHLDIPNEPLFPFGFGLSYNHYEYGDIMLNKTTMSNQDSIIASIKITNSGQYDGKEIVQLYIRDNVCSITRPVKELKAFKRLSFSSGETKTVDFKISPDLLSFIDMNLNSAIEAGDFTLFIGENSSSYKQTEFTFLNH
jgi:beta-glucosidase